MNYPKICYVCSMAHISCKEDEVLQHDGAIVVHKNCVGKPVVVHEYKDNRMEVTE